jgi:cation diffusion facilitator family transporter
MAESGTAVVAALVGNGALAILKGASAAFTGSAAMLAETFHSIADTGNEALLLLGLRLARRPPDDDHPFGHGKDVYFWAFVVAIMLFTLGGAWSIWEAVRHYLHPIDKRASLWAYAVLGGGFLFESCSLGFALCSLSEARGDRPVRQYWQESRDPTLLTVLLEDSAALVSLSIAALGLWLTGRTGNGIWDAAASALIGVLLLGVAVMLAAENYSLLIGETAPARVEQAIREVVRREGGVQGIRELHTMHLGPRRLLIVLGVQFACDLRAPDVASLVTRLQQKLVQALGDITDARLIVIEPAPLDAAPASPGARSSPAPPPRARGM